jgi:hypothetical protein
MSKPEKGFNRARGKIDRAGKGFGLPELQQENIVLHHWEGNF